MRNSNHQNGLYVLVSLCVRYAALMFFVFPAACGNDLPASGQTTIGVMEDGGPGLPPVRGHHDSRPDAARPDTVASRPDAGPVTPPDAGTSILPDAGAPEAAAVDVAPPPVTTVPPGLDLTGGMAVFLALDEPDLSSIAHDSSGQKNVANLRGFAERHSVWVDGRFGGALALPGGTTGGWIEIDSAPILNAVASSFTIAAWMYRGAGQSDDGTILARHAGGTTGCLYCFDLKAGGLHLGINTGNGYFGDINADRPVPKGVWVHVAATFSQGTARLYMDGEQVGTGAYGLGLAPDRTPVTVGAVQDAAGASGNRLGARLDDVLLYTRALAPKELAALAAGFNMSALALSMKHRAAE